MGAPLIFQRLEFQQTKVPRIGTFGEDFSNRADSKIKCNESGNPKDLSGSIRSNHEHKGDKPWDIIILA
ncbi:MAG: hypothetical protein KDM64_18175, partial [Verrucomicrobiae bacterium]|nr:hypothetical protein [Verrucomicrobiae bacterium]